MLLFNNKQFIALSPVPFIVGLFGVIVGAAIVSSSLSLSLSSELEDSPIMIINIYPSC